MVLTSETCPAILGLAAITGIGLAVVDLETKAFEWCNEFLNTLVPENHRQTVLDHAILTGSKERVKIGNKWLSLSVNEANQNGEPTPGLPKASLRILSVQDDTEVVEAKEKTETILNTTYDGYFDWFIKDDYEYMSPRFWEMFGYEASEKEHHPSAWMSIINQEDAAIAMQNFELHVASKGKEKYHQFVRYTHKDGHTVHVLCRGRVVEWAEDGSPIRMIGTHTDMTETVRAAEEAREAKRSKAELESHANDRMRLINYLFHELRNPLHIISIGLTSIFHAKNIDLERFVLCTDSAEVDEDVDTLMVMKTSIERAIKILDDTHIFETLEAGEFTFEMQPVAIGQLVRTVVKSFQIQKYKARLHLVDLGDMETVLVETDVNRLMQVLGNILENGIKHANSRVQVRLRMNSESNDVVIECLDDGVGINTTKLTGIAKPYNISRNESMHEDKIKFGLNLAISQRLTTGMGGNISVATRKGHGCQFTVTLPILSKVPSDTVSSVPRILKVRVPECDGIRIDDNHFLKFNSVWVDYEIDGEEVYPIQDKIPFKPAKDIKKPPVEHTQKESKIGMPIPGHENKGGMTGLSVILVDDDELNRKIIVRMFKKLGIHNVVEIVNGEEFFDYVQKGNLKKDCSDFILLDEAMPKMNGSEALMALKEKNLIDSIPVFMLTGCVTSDDIDRYEKAKVQGVINKPLMMPKLVNVLQEFGFLATKDKRIRK